jgi:hypothetical protein
MRGLKLNRTYPVYADVLIYWARTQIQKKSAEISLVAMNESGPEVNRHHLTFYILKISQRLMTACGVGGRLRI